MKKLHFIFIGIILLLHCLIYAGTTGKLAGKVIDEEGRPVPFANVILEEAGMGAQTKENGTYIILNIPPGKYNVLCQRGGYIPKKLKNVVIRFDLTKILNFTLKKTALKVDEFEVSEARVKMIQPGKTGPGREIKAEDMEDIAVDNLEGIVAIQAGASLTKDENIEIVDTIEETTLDSYEEALSAPTTKTGKDKKRKSKPPRSGVTASSYSGLRAGFVDDNKQFNYFLNFLEKYNRRVKSIPIDITERIILNIKDGQGKSIPDAKIRIFAGKKELENGLSYSDGSYLYFPSEYDSKLIKYRLEVEYSGITEEVMIYRQEKREIDISIANIQKAPLNNIPLDILFVLDTTGSMSEEIKRLRNSIEIINLNISEISPTPNIRYGMVLYRDIKDIYNTKVIPLNDDLREFQYLLADVKADGGGDKPENLQAALDDALNKINWRENGVRLVFIITDAPPHLDYQQDYNYVNAVHDAKSKGIKLFSIGTGGLPIGGEYVLRQISQYTSANYVFLTYGEKGESEGGAPGSVSHHTGENFQTDKLEAIIIRKVKEELHNYLGKPLTGGDEYLLASKIDDEENKVTLDKLFARAITQLQDYSSIKIPDNTPAAVLPIMCSNNLKVTAEYFTANLLFAFSKAKTFKAIERDDLQKIIEEQKLQLTGFTDLNKAFEIGKIMGVDMLITGELFEKEKFYELYVKLLKVETAEVLSVTKTKIERSLGL